MLYNNYDCGLFLTLKIYLNIWGALINKLMYDQHILYKQKLRRGIASSFIRDDKMATLPELFITCTVGRASRNTQKHDKTIHASSDEPKRSKRVKMGDSEASHDYKGTQKRAIKSLCSQGQTQLTLDQIPTHSFNSYTLQLDMAFLFSPSPLLSFLPVIVVGEVETKRDDK